MRKVLMLFPPGWSINGPYLSVPQLSSYLSANGIDNIAVDLNIQVHNLIIGYVTSGKSYGRIDVALAEKNISEEKRKELLLCKELHNQIIDKLDEEIHALRACPTDPESYIRRQRVVETAFRIYSAPFYPGRIYNGQIIKVKKSVPKSYLKPEDYEMCSTISGVVEFFKDKTINPIFEPISELLGTLDLSNIDLVGISTCGYTQLMPALCVSDLIKKSHSLPVVMGGAIMPYIINGVKKNPVFFDYIDLLVNGEGEVPLLKICNSLNDLHGASRNIGGVVYYDKDMRVVVENENCEVLDVNLKPTPDFSCFPLTEYFAPKDLLMLPVLGSTGCYWGKCSFCGVNCNYNKRHRKRSVELILEDMKQLSSKHSVNNFRFIDNCVDPGTIRMLSQAILKQRLNFKWTCLCRFEKSFTRHIWEKAFLAGLG